MDEIVLEGKAYIGSKKAAQECGYTQDYVGQLARKGLIDAQRVSGQWYVFLESLKNYKQNAETFKPEPPKYQPDPNVEATINVEGKEYVSAARASKLTDYNQDYVGQLARAGKIPSRQVGTRWYVEREALLTHKKEKDAMLRAVQAESVGLKRVEPKIPQASALSFATTKKPEPLLAYTKDEKVLFPEINDEASLKAVPYEREPELAPITGPSRIAIRVIKNIEVPMEEEAEPVIASGLQLPSQKKVSIPRNTIFSKLFVPAAFSLVLLVAVGVGTYKRDLIYSYVSGDIKLSQPASVGDATKGVGDVLEQILTKELVYVRK